MKPDFTDFVRLHINLRSCYWRYRSTPKSIQLGIREDPPVLIDFTALSMILNHGSISAEEYMEKMIKWGFAKANASRNTLFFPTHRMIPIEEFFKINADQTRQNEDFILERLEFSSPEDAFLGYLKLACYLRIADRNTDVIGQTVNGYHPEVRQSIYLTFVSGAGRPFMIQAHNGYALEWSLQKRILAREFVRNTSFMGNT